MTRHILIIMSLLSLSVVGQENATKAQSPRNVIFMLGDGMGLSQVSAALFYGDKPSNFERFPVIGLMKTSSAKQLVTDSGAGATAFASGVKTYNGAIGVDADTIPVKNIPEIISPMGYATGIIATSSVMHASIANFYAHVPYRFSYEEIAAQLVDSDLDFVAGGGEKFLNERKDGQDLFPKLENAGFTIYRELPDRLTGKRNLIMVARDGLPNMEEGRGDYLPKTTKMALDHFRSSGQQFFLVVEGSQIDWGGHDNDASYLISEVIDFDQTIGVALDFADKTHDTLVIVLADHETGGFTLSADGNNYNKIAPTFSTGGHSATMVPVFAYGPGSELFSGVYENTEIYHKIMSLLLPAEDNMKR